MPYEEFRGMILNIYCTILCRSQVSIFIFQIPMQLKL